MNNSDTLFAKNQQTFTSNETSFKSEVDSGFQANFSESEIQTIPEGNEIEEKNKIQNDDCCGDCNSINCPHCDCSFW